MILAVYNMLSIAYNKLRAEIHALKSRTEIIK